MFRKRYVLVFTSVALALAGCVAVTPEPTTPTPAPAPAFKPYDYMAALRRAEEAAVAGDRDRSKRSAAFQILAAEQSMIGDTQAAIANYDSGLNRQAPRDPDRAAARAILERYEVRDAVATIVAAARDRQIVILNEAHHVPRHRAFATALMLELRKVGFDHFAAETLADRTESLAARGYPVIEDGYYTREPVFGDLVRRALAVGYKPVAYEQSSPTPTPGIDIDWTTRVALREAGQARNLAERVFAKDPKARVFIHVGFSHALEEPEDAGNGRKTAWMAARLKEKIGIDPLTIDQATERPVLGPLSEDAFAGTTGESAVLVAREGGEFWRIRSGFDLTVVHRPTRLVGGRPHWLAMDGYRAPWAIPAKLLPKKGRRLVQAFVASETGNAVAMDQVLVEATKPPPKLMLPKGNYRFAVQD
jgi:hypothetical protein